MKKLIYIHLALTFLLCSGFTDYYLYYDEAGNRQERTITKRLKIGVMENHIESDLNLLYDLKISPNPTHDFINVNLNNYDGESIIECELVDINGKKVKSKSRKSSTIKLDVYNLTVGTYFLRVKSTNSIQTVQVIIKE
jgi:hypothetical protein